MRRRKPPRALPHAAMGVQVSQNLIMQYLTVDFETILLGLLVLLGVVQRLLGPP